MNWKEKLQAAWKNRDVIAEGFFNAFVTCGPEVKVEALRRLEICRSNKCGFHDPTGSSDAAVFKGKESCGGCGCDLYAKCHAMSANCFLRDLQLREFRKIVQEGFTEGMTIGDIETVKTGPDPDVWIILKRLQAENISVPVGMGPLWEAVLSVEQEMEINKIAYRKQFENRK